MFRVHKNSWNWCSNNTILGTEKSPPYLKRGKFISIKLYQNKQANTIRANKSDKSAHEEQGSVDIIQCLTLNTITLFGDASR